MALAAALGPLDGATPPAAARGGRRPVMIATLARAKVNLALAVIGRRADGFHDLVSVFARLDLADELTVEPSDGPDRLELADGSIALPARRRRPRAAGRGPPADGPGAGRQRPDLPPDQARAPGGRARRRQRRCRGRARPCGPRLGRGADRRRAARPRCAPGLGRAVLRRRRRRRAGHRPRRAPRAAARPARSGRRPARDQRPRTLGHAPSSSPGWRSTHRLDRAAHDADAALAARDLAASLARGLCGVGRGGHGAQAAGRQRPVAGGDPSAARPRRAAHGARSAARPAAPALGLGPDAARSVSFEGGCRRRGDRAPVRCRLRRARCGDPVGDLRAHRSRGRHDEPGAHRDRRGARRHRPLQPGHRGRRPGLLLGPAGARPGDAASSSMASPPRPSAP